MGHPSSEILMRSAIVSVDSEVRNLRKIATVYCYCLVKYWCLDVPEMDTDLLQNFIEHNEVDKLSLRIF